MADDDREEEGPEEREEAEGPTVLTSRKASLEEPYRENEAEVVEWVESLYQDAEKGRDEQADFDAWAKAEDVYWGDQWPDSIPGYKPRIVVNEIKSLVLQELSDLTDSRLVIIAQKEPGSLERDPAVERTIQMYWRRHFCDLTVGLAALDAMIFPLGFLQSGWDPLAEQGQGDVVLKHRDPRSVYPDPDADGDDTLRYLILEHVLDLIQIRRDFPETGWLVQPEAAYSMKLDQAKERPTPRAGSGYQGPLYTQTGLGTGVPGWKKARARLLTCVVEDDASVEEIREIEGKLVQMRMPKYPHKRMIQVANRRVLYNDDCPLWYAPMLTRVMLQPAVHSYWPQQSLVSEFAEIQSSANKLDSMVVENGLRLNAGEVYADADSGISPKSYGGLPGMVYLTKPGARVQKVYPPPMPPDMIQAGERLRGFIRSTMGYPLSRTGAGTHGNVAAELAETEISQAMGLTRLRGRLLYQSVHQAVQMIFARMAQFYTVPRHLPYIEDHDLKSVKWEVLQNPERYAIHVDEAAFQVRSKTMMQRLVLALAKMGKMPTNRLLKFLEIPDADEIAREMQAELMLVAAAKGRELKGRSRS